MDCCTVETRTEAPAYDPVIAPEPHDDTQHACRSCKGASRPVTRQTVLLMLKPELFDSVGDGAYRFCSDRNCRVVYFTDGGGPTFRTDDVRVRVGLKERVDPIPLCYCFGFDEKDVREEITGTGSTTIPARIAALIKQRMCACPAKNPSGACCLGEVKDAVRRLSRS